MHTRTERPISPRDFAQVLFRHKNKVATWCGLVMALSIAALVLLPRKYESEAKLFLKLGRESIGLDPTATTGVTVPVQESRETEINSTRDMLKSRAVLESVVAKLGPELILNGPPGTSHSSIGGFVSGLGE